MAPVGAEIDVDVRHGDPFRVEESFEQQPVLQGIDISDLQAVGDQASRCRAPAGTDRDLVLPGVAHEVPDNQKIARVAHLLDDPDFMLEPLLVSLQGELQLSSILPRSPIGESRLETLPAHLLEIFVQAFLPGHLEVRKGLSGLFELELTAFRDGQSLLDGLRVVTEKVRHFPGTLHVELVGGKTHSVAVTHRFAGLYAKQHLVGAGVLPGDVVAVVGGNDRNVQGLGQPNQVGDDALLDLQTLILEFDEIVVLSKNILVFPGDLPGLFVLPSGQVGADLAA